MFSRRLRILVISATVAAAALGVAQPALAQQLSQTGTVGVHSMTDTSGHPGAIGRYKWYASDNAGYLNRFYVNPPNMRAVAGNASQTVGWLYMVERKDCGLGGCGPWKHTFTSVEFTAVTSDAHNASFSQATASVTGPCDHGCSDGGSLYRITVKMIWHHPNGSVQGTVLFRIHWYGAQVTNGDHGVQEKAASSEW
jgi:hypothetical protein